VPDAGELEAVFRETAEEVALRDSGEACLDREIRVGLSHHL